jgi:hypothetical protein
MEYAIRKVQVHQLLFYGDDVNILDGTERNVQKYMKVVLVLVRNLDWK